LNQGDVAIIGIRLVVIKKKIVLIYLYYLCPNIF